MGKFYPVHFYLLIILEKIIEIQCFFCNWCRKLSRKIGNSVNIFAIKLKKLYTYMYNKKTEYIFV